MLGNSDVTMVSVFPSCGHATSSWIVKMGPMNVAVVFTILCSATDIVQYCQSFLNGGLFLYNILRKFRAKSYKSMMMVVM